ncbi:lysophospholipid acyltransferase family protein [Tenacibaculum geojense]|uniref:Lysophospholipid acyltransferase family protein n=1 Tax=Tenacibaculum geojense TaxID=915352 RepID=A0ABW3JNK0_9FLAO
MKFIAYILIYPLVYLLSILPMRILYLISDFFFFITYYIVGYRKDVIKSNLRLAYPNKSEEEINTLTKKNLRHFTDFIVETLKTFTISEKEVDKRYTYKNIELIRELEANNKSIVLTGAHYANWEWMFAIPRLINHKAVGSYKKISNPYFDKVVKSSRSKFGFEGVPTTNTTKKIAQQKKDGVLAFYVLLCDQTPGLNRAYYWTKFLNVFVPVITGPETIAKKHDFNVVNFTSTRVKRGYYEVEFQLITTTPQETEKFEITNKFIELTEKHIEKNPEFYLWTHKRFKHKDKFDIWNEKYNKQK